MSHPPLHLTARDFDAYALEKATSNAYSRPRLEVKQRALAWSRGVVARLAELDIAVDVHGSDEHPTRSNKKRVESQWVFFSRDPAARDELDRLLDRGRSIAAEIDDPSPYTRHAFLALRLDSSAVEVCFAVHPDAAVDVDNLRARLAPEAPALTAEIMAALAALPEQFAIGVSPDDHVPANAATPEAVRALVERAAAGHVPLRIGWSITRDTAVEHSALLDEQLEDAIVALAPVYRLIAWSRENDRIALDRRIETVEHERARAHAEAEAQTERWRSAQAEARRLSLEQARARSDELRRSVRSPRRPSLDDLFSPKPAPTAVLQGAPPAAGAPPPRPATPAPATRPARPVEASAVDGDVARAVISLEKGSRARVLTGPFADKIGIIGDLDGRGGARVLLGLLSTRLDVADLEPAVDGRGDRPAMQSSHRRPHAPAPRKAR